MLWGTSKVTNLIVRNNKFDKCINKSLFGVWLTGSLRGIFMFLALICSIFSKCLLGMVCRDLDAISITTGDPIICMFAAEMASKTAGSSIGPKTCYVMTGINSFLAPGKYSADVLKIATQGDTHLQNMQYRLPSSLMKNVHTSFAL
jgi:hypothetical protein